jgi:hypothetical protein
MYEGNRKRSADDDEEAKSETHEEAESAAPIEEEAPAAAKKPKIKKKKEGRKQYVNPVEEQRGLLTSATEAAAILWKEFTDGNWEQLYTALTLFTAIDGSLSGVELDEIRVNGNSFSFMPLSDASRASLHSTRGTRSYG